MRDLKLFIANKKYSSWSFRPWIAIKVKELPVKEVFSRFDFASGNVHFAEFSPNNQVPVLHHGDLVVWDSLAILEYLAELFPEAGLWPKDPATRAKARSIVCEMHSGFSALRAECPMNMSRQPASKKVSSAVIANVERITGIWKECLKQSGGPFLFGDFSIADAMFAPVINRFAIYKLVDDPVISKYAKVMTGLDAWKEWEVAGKAESWIVEQDED